MLRQSLKRCFYSLETSVQDLFFFLVTVIAFVLGHLAAYIYICLFVIKLIKLILLRT